MPARRRQIKEVRVKTWVDLQRELYEESWNPVLQRFRSDFAYRGVSNADWDLHTSLSRLGGNYRELEGHLLRNFMKYASGSLPRMESEWVWLALAQHHGLPTRMLDWTYSPYTALHFATVNLTEYNNDAIVWCVNYVRAHELLPVKLRNVLRSERSNVFTSEMLERCATNLVELEKLSRKQFAVFLEPPSLDERIVNQYALFSFMSDPRTQFDDWVEASRPDLVRRIIIPRELKWEIRDKLDQANITERVLFPGLDGLSQWLRRHYLPMTDAYSGAEADRSEQVPERRRMSGDRD
jgi:hypothetical protein